MTRRTRTSILDQPTLFEPLDCVGCRLCVLASGSSGNCSVLTLHGEAGSESWLIDLGLSPRRTRRLLKEVGVDESTLRGALLTHLDHDHIHPGWRSATPPLLYIYERHMGRAERLGLLQHRTIPFTGLFSPSDRLHVSPLRVRHDDLGSVSFRLRVHHGLRPLDLGFATDVGSPSDELITHLRGVDVLAIESNHCPQMQEASGRPLALQRRIMGGAGHLNNTQCARAVEAIGPKEHVVLLHLSRQCNDPELAAAYHAGRAYQLTIARHDEPTPWITIGLGAAAAG